MNLTETQKATLAGFFDADGTLGVYMCQVGKPSKKTGRVWKYPRLKVSVSGIHRESIARYRELFGFGTLYLDQKERRRYATHSLWTWSTSGQNARDVLMSLAPYLCVKKEQAELACSLPIHKQGQRFTDEERAYRSGVVDRLKNLKREVA